MRRSPHRSCKSPRVGSRPEERECFSLVSDLRFAIARRAGDGPLIEKVDDQVNMLTWRAALEGQE